MPLDSRQLLRRSSRWALIGFTLKGTCTLSIMAWTAFMAWSGRDAALSGKPWHGPLLLAGSVAVGALCVVRFVRRRQQRTARAEP